MSDLISIIIPVYNVEKYIKMCLNSVANQSYRDIEVILVNDGSSDKSAEICDKFCCKDSRFKVIHKQNEGVSAARNTGLNACQGAYVTFIDGDDFVRPCYISNLYSTAIRTKSDVVTSDFCGYTTSDTIITSSYKKKGRTISDGMTGEEALTLMLRMRENCSVWSKLFTRRSIGDLRFPVGKINEDGLFLFYLYLNIDKIASIAAAEYFYRINPNGLARTINDHQFDIISNIDEMKAHLAKSNTSKQCKNALKIWETNYCTNLLFAFKTCNTKQYADHIKDIKLRVRSNMGKVFFSRDLTLKNKIKSILIILGY